MRSKDPRIVSLRAVRKATHLSGKVARKSASILERVEHKTSRVIINKAGSITGEENISINHFMHHTFPYLAPVHPALPEVGQKPSVTVFAFLDPKGFYGGIATLLLVAAELANKLGYDLRVAQTTGYSKKTDVLKFLSANGIEVSPDRYSTLDLSLRTPDHFAYLPLHPDDVMVVSAWWDAQVAAQLPLKNKFVYLIQDYEPIFYNNSDAQCFADQTYYTNKFIPLCNTELLYDFFAEQGYDYIKQTATWFEPAPAPRVSSNSPTKSSASTKKLFLYGRPSVHRNLFFSAVKALDLAFSSNESLRTGGWQIFCAGQADIPSIKLSSGHVIKNLGKMNLDEYYSFAASIDVAVSPMLAPHPNYPTLELASLGAMVVSTKYKTKQDLSRYSSNILMAEPTVEDMAQKIVDACSTSNTTRQANAASTNIGSDWAKNLDKPLDAVLKKLQV